MRGRAQAAAKDSSGVPVSSPMPILTQRLGRAGKGLDFILSHESSGVLDQIAQNIESLWRQGHTFFSAPETVVGRVKAE